MFGLFFKGRGEYICHYVLVYDYPFLNTLVTTVLLKTSIDYLSTVIHNEKKNLSPSYGILLNVQLNEENRDTSPTQHSRK